MSKQRAVAAIDVGTTKVAVVVADATEFGEVRVLGIGVAPAEGISRGMVDNIAAARESIRAALDRAERSSGMRILSAHVGVSGSHVQSLNNRGIISVPSRQHPISEEDRARVLEGARNISIPQTREILHVLPRTYWVDGQDNVSDPVGMYGQRLDVETHVVVGAVTAIQNLTRCVEGTGVQVEGIVLESLASARAVLEPEEAEQGVAVLDIGGGSTSIAAYIEGSVAHTAVLPVGGYHLTHDLVIGLRCPLSAAEQVKQEHGVALVADVTGSESIEIEAFGSQRRKEIPLYKVAEILQPRAEEILEMAEESMRGAGVLDAMSAGVVLTGGSAKLAGLDRLAEAKLEMPARIGTPQGLTGLIETVSDPAYATTVGLAIWALERGSYSVRANGHESGAPSTISSFLRRVAGWGRALLPE
jgi:cell division protein FtsA